MPGRRVPAAEIEAAVIDQMRGVLRTPEVIVATWRSARDQGDGLNEADVTLTKPFPLEWREQMQIFRIAIGA